ncbi:MAG: DNA repair protein RecO [Planctomycetes bacterium]|nr:DNA repair protein RecO [Planctomycetota bacterium]NUQ35491.1 DNA repair protein RecO [Planctomycetaceae bacterium]
MPELHTEAIVLRVTPYSETSQVLRLLTPHGMRSILARGIKRPRNAFGGPADILTVLEADIAVKRGHDPLHMLSRARQTIWFPNLRHSLTVYYGAEYLREIALAIPTPDHDAPKTFDLMLRALAALNDGHLPVAVDARFAAAILRLHGLEPQLGHCVVSGDEVNDNTALFSHLESGLVSSKQASHAPDAVRMRPEVIDLLRRIFDTNRSEGEFRIDFWLAAFNVCTRLMELGVGRMLRVPPLLLAEMARGVAKPAHKQAVHA